MGKYKKDDILKVKVTAVEPYGIFVNVDNEYSGLIHISEITGGYIRNINKYIKKGQIVNVKVLEIIEDKKQLKLSMKSLKKRKINRKPNVLEESGQGFKPLKENLSKWMDLAKKEIEKYKK